MKYNKGTSDLGLIIIVLVVLFLLWLVTGGKNHPEATSGPTLTSPYVNPVPIQPNININQN